MVDFSPDWSYIIHVRYDHGIPLRMQVFRHLTEVVINPSACAIGMFDGVHLGHHMVLEQAIRSSHIDRLDSVVFTFANHPQSLISQTPTPLLSTLEERLKTFKAMGFTHVLVLDFTPDIRSLTAEDFVRRVLVETLHVQAVSVGYDHRFGRDRRGDGFFLKEQGKRYGFSVDVVEPVRVNQQIVSKFICWIIMATCMAKP
jgi:riboflavin kinase/FMN adenylyltransferase